MWIIIVILVLIVLVKIYNLEEKNKNLEKINMDYKRDELYKKYKDYYSELSLEEVNKIRVEKYDEYSKKLEYYKKVAEHNHYENDYVNKVRTPSLEEQATYYLINECTDLYYSYKVALWISNGIKLTDNRYEHDVSDWL